MNQGKITQTGVASGFTSEYNCYHNDGDKLKHQLQQLIALLLLWRHNQKSRNMLIEAKIGLLRNEIKFYYLESTQLIEFAQTRYSDIYLLAIYTASIQALVRYKYFLNQPVFRLDETLDDDFFPVTDNVYNIIKTSVLDNLKYLIRYFIHRSKRLK